MEKHKIGVCITTKDRRESFRKSYDNWLKYLPDGAILRVVDDGSMEPVKEANFRFDAPTGIASAKNKSLEILDAEDCEHMFLSDDDFWPISPDWWKPYIECGQPHAMYIFCDFATGRKLNDTVKVYEDDKISAYSHARGCMLYIHSSILQYVGGMDTIFKSWGYEHSHLSNRIYNVGLTQFRYMDVVNSAGLFYSADEHQEGFSTCTGMERRAQIMRNKPIYESRLNSSEYVPYKNGAERKGRNKAGDANMVLTCYFTSVADPQGREWHYDFDPVLKLAESVLKGHRPTGDKFIVFHDCVKKNDVIVDDRSLPYRKPSINPYFQRWVTYRQWLIEHQAELDFVWCVDATDVEMLRDPFPHMEKGKLYVGDEPDTLRSVWLNKYHQHPKLKGFFARNSALPLLNAGLVGGDVDTMLEYTARMIDMYQEGEHDAKLKRSPNAGLTDMGAHNYVCYTHFKGRVIHGKQINTEFKKYEADNGVSFWKHK